MVQLIHQQNLAPQETLEMLQVVMHLVEMLQVEDQMAIRKNQLVRRN